MSPKNDADFKKLEKEWYGKLAESGFQDIEVSSHENRFLKKWSFNLSRKRWNLIHYETTLEYYKKAQDLLNSFKFKNRIHKKIWKLHASGLSERKIAHKIKIYKKSMVHYIIAQISREIKEG